MRITFVIPDAGLAGGIKVVAIYAARLIQRGHVVTVVSSPVPVRQLSFSRKALNFVLGREQATFQPPKTSYFTELGVPIHVLEAARPVVDKDVPDADVVIATWWETAEWVSSLSEKKGKKVYFIQHHEVFPNLPVNRSRATYRLPLHKIVISHWLKELMNSQYGDPDVDLILNSVDTNQFFAPGRRKQPVPTIGFLYSTVGFKSVEVLLRALDLVKAEVPNLRALCFGSDVVSTKLPLPEWVQFHHQPPQKDIRMIYSECDLWLCASQSEGFHLPPLEAMACRCPVVSTRVGGPMDIIKDDENGYLVEVGDTKGIAEKAINVLRLTEQKWQLMSESALSTALGYSWDDATERLVLSLQHLVRSSESAIA